MNEHKMDSLKEGEYYDKAYAKDHDSYLDGESLTQEIGGKSLSSEIKDGIKDISEFLWIFRSKHGRPIIILFKKKSFIIIKSVFIFIFQQQF